MDQEINQYLSAQREQSSLNHRDGFDREERHRDRMRRRERDRERRRQERRTGRERERERSRERGRDHYEQGRLDDYQVPVGYTNGFGDGINPVGRLPNNCDYDKLHIPVPKHNDDFDNYSEGSQPESYGRDMPLRDSYRDSRDSRERDLERDRDMRDREPREPHDNRDHRDRDYGREEKGGERWMTANPTNTILLRGLVPQIDEKDIRAELMMFGAPIKEVRLMKRKDTGVSRGFAFVEFQNVTDAQRWMAHNQGQVLMLSQYTVSMYYSTPKTGLGTPMSAESPRGGNALDNWSRTDWICNKCGVHNFRRRDFCFKCNISKEASESERAKEGDGFDQVGTNPCNTLILRGLDALTTEEKLVAAVSQVTTLQVKNMKVIRDDLTGTSRSFGFAEMSSIQESTELLNAIQTLKHPFEVDGKAVMVSYAKNTFTTTMATMNLSQFVVAAQTTAWDYAASTYDYSQTAYYDQTTGQYYDPTTGTYYDPQSYDYAAYYGSEYQQPASIAVPNTTGSGQQDTTNAAAAVAQAAIQQAQAAKQYQKQHETMQKQIVAQMQQQQKLAEMTPEQRLVHEAQEWSTLPGATPTSGSVAMVSAQPVQPTQHVATSATEYPKYPIPDVSSYQYDEASGYYYDPVTSLYYDANSQYYYNSTTGQFMYWDGEQQTYLPAPTESQETTGDNQNPEQKKGKEKDKKEKVKVAKKIAKDMEKWAKTLNAQKEAMKEGFKKSFQPLAGGGEGGGVGGSSGGGGGHGYKESASADAGFAILEKRAVMDRKAVIDVFKKDEPKSLMPPPVMPGKSNEAIPGLVASYGGDSDEDEEDDGGMDPTDETKHVDLNKMACLLCKRQFPNKDALTRHTQLSDLHRKNLEDLHKRQAAAQAAGISIQYRDRAKERRQKYGIPTPPTPKKKAAQFEAPEPYEQPTKEGIGHENIGNKLLQKMGWSKGQGLGKANQGIVDPIQAMHRQQQAGLGARGSSYQVNPADSYKETVKKVMFARYQELQ